MGLDSRGIERGGCVRCDCADYAVNPRSPSLGCSYCDHFPTVHSSTQRIPQQADQQTETTSDVPPRNTLKYLFHMMVITPMKVMAGGIHSVAFALGSMITIGQLAVPYIMIVGVVLPSRFYIFNILDENVQYNEAYQILVGLTAVLWICVMFCIALWTKFSINIVIILSTPLVMGVFQSVVYWVKWWNALNPWNIWVYCNMLVYETLFNNRYIVDFQKEIYAFFH